MDDSIFLSRMRDIARLCDKYRTAKFSRFLDSREQVVLEHNRISGTLFGGYEYAERRIFGVFPDFQEPALSLFPIDLLKITVNCIRLKIRKFHLFSGNLVCDRIFFL